MDSSLTLYLMFGFNILMIVVAFVIGWIAHNVYSSLYDDKMDALEIEMLDAEARAQITQLVTSNPHPECYDKEGCIITNEDYWTMQDLSSTYSGEWPPGYDIEDYE